MSYNKEWDRTWLKLTVCLSQPDPIYILLCLWKFLYFYHIHISIKA